MEYKVTLNDFEGPLDLLLTLIKKSDINILDIKISDITDQYLAFIKDMEILNLSISGEYLVMAAELIELKSATLLPKPVNNEVDDDPREELINKLLLYKKYKEVSEQFRNLETERNLIYSKEPSNLSIYKKEDEVEIENLELDILMEVFNDFLKRRDDEKPLITKITTKEYSIFERSKQIKTLLKEKKSMDFFDLFDIYTKEYIIITFLSILELARKREIEIEQEDNFKKIIINDVSK